MLHVHILSLLVSLLLNEVIHKQQLKHLINGSTIEYLVEFKLQKQWNECSLVNDLEIPKQLHF